MKMIVYYVVRHEDFGGKQVKYIAGPFGERNDANEVLEKIIGRHDYFIVAQEIEVKTI